MTAAVAYAWVIGGLVLAVVVARWVAVEDHKHPDPEEPHTNTTIGFLFLLAWILAPLVALIGLGVGLSWCIGRVLRPQPRTASRQEGDR